MRPSPSTPPFTPVTFVTPGLGTPDESSRADRSPAEPAGDLVHRPLGLVPAGLGLAEGQLTRGLLGGDQILDPHTDQSEWYPIQPRGLIQLDGCGIDHTRQVGRFPQG